MRVPTSVILQELLRDSPDDVTLEWIIANLRERSFGIVMLLIALVGLVPGLSPLVGLTLAIPAVQVMRGHREPVLPRRLATRHLSKARLARILARVIPILGRMERLVRPRWGTPFETTKRLVGFVILLLDGTLLAPVPFSHIIPVLVVALLAFAFLEEDGVLLCISLAAAVVSLAITTAAIWGPWRSPRSGNLETAVAGEARRRQGSAYRLQSRAFGPRPKSPSKSSAKRKMTRLSTRCDNR